MVISNKPCKHCQDLKSAHLDGKCLFGPQRYDAYPHAKLEAAVLRRVRMDDAGRPWHRFDFVEHTATYYVVNCISGTVLPRVVYVYPDEIR